MKALTSGASVYGQLSPHDMTLTLRKRKRGFKIRVAERKMRFGENNGTRCK